MFIRTLVALSLCQILIGAGSPQDIPQAPASTQEGRDPQAVGLGFVQLTKAQNSWELLAPLEELFKDRAIRAIVLLIDGNPENTKYGTYNALAQIINHLKSQYPKLVVAYSERKLQGSQYLAACAADEIIVSQDAQVGRLSYSFALTNNSEKNKIEGKEYHFAHRGFFKPLLGCTDAPANMAQLPMLQEFVSQINSELFKQITAKRKQLDAINQEVWGQGNLFCANEAIPLNLVDTLATKTELLKYICKKLSVPFDPKKIFYVHKKPTKVSEVMAKFTIPDNKIALGVVRIGKIESASSWNYYPLLFEIFSRPDITGIILSVESSGGDCALGLAIYDDIMQLKKSFKKPVVSYVEDNALSMAYLIACAGDCIISSPLARIGSVGIYSAKWDLSKKNAKEGIQTILASEYEIDSSSYEQLPFTDKKQEALEKTSEFFYKRVTKNIICCRPQLEKTGASWKEAQIFSGSKALELGLVDQLGGHQEVLAHLRKASKADIRADIVAYIFTDQLGTKESPIEIGK